MGFFDFFKKKKVEEAQPSVLDSQVGDQEYHRACETLAKSKNNMAFVAPYKMKADIALSAIVRNSKQELIVFTKRKDWQSEFPLTNISFSKYTGKVTGITELRIPNENSGLANLEFMMIGDGQSIFMIVNKKGKLECFVCYSWPEFISNLLKEQSNTKLSTIKGLKVYQKQPKYEKYIKQDIIPLT